MVLVRNNNTNNNNNNNNNIKQCDPTWKSKKIKMLTALLQEHYRSHKNLKAYKK
jgi:hypothetical protein